MRNSPDRYISPRPAEPGIAYRLRKHPHSLSPRERYTRRRDDTADPFRSPSNSRSRNALTRRLTGQRSSPLYYIPSFVNNHDAAPVNTEVSDDLPRQISARSIWNVGGRAAAQGGHTRAVSDGFGGYLASGSSAPMHTTHFLDERTPTDQRITHENCLALALGIDPARPILMGSLPTPAIPQTFAAKYSPFSWQNGAWTRMSDHQNLTTNCNRRSAFPEKAVPLTPFRVLDAPNLKDDYYCTVLAYSHSHRTLAVALTQKVYLWTEKNGVEYPPIPQARPSNYITSLSFSSTEGGKGILAVSRHSGQVLLWSINEQWTRFEAPHPHSVSCVSFKPTVSHRTTDDGCRREIPCEDLLVGDDMGTIYYYSVEWPDLDIPGRHTAKPGAMTLLSRVAAHVQNICGLAWCPDGKHFATGGNDNTAFFFDIGKVLEQPGAKSSERPRGRLRRRASSPVETTAPTLRPATLTPSRSPDHPYVTGDQHGHPLQTAWATVFTQMPPVQLDSPPPSPPRVQTRSPSPPRRDIPSLLVSHPSARTPYQSVSRQIVFQRLPLPTLPTVRNHHTYSFIHSAAVKALAFAPWQPSLLATGGGSNDRQIHFHHTGSGATLAVVNVFAQITCLIWSKTRREIAATFGYAQPEHGVRVAVFAWPSCECVVKIPWEGRQGAGEIPRALWAVGYPGGPNDGLSGMSARIRANQFQSRERREARAEMEREIGTEGFRQWAAIAEMERRAREDQAQERGGRIEQANMGRESGEAHIPDLLSSESMTPNSFPTSPSLSPSRRATEGDSWTSRTEEEGSLIIACCDSTVKFFEVWAGSSKSRKGRGLGGKMGVLGGSRILEGEVVGIYGEEGDANGHQGGRMGWEGIR